MTADHAAAVLAGAVAMGFATIGVFFLRFWRTSRERLFLAFAAAFWLMSVGQILSAAQRIVREDLAIVYLPRLAAFSLIIFAIVRKNLADRAKR